MIMSSSVCASSLRCYLEMLSSFFCYCYSMITKHRPYPSNRGQIGIVFRLHEYNRNNPNTRASEQLGIEIAVKAQD